MARYPFMMLDTQPGSLMPRLPLEITFGYRSIQVAGIVDTGSADNVLPYRVGLALGALWDKQEKLGPLSEGQAGVESRALPILAKIPELTETTDVPLVFAWASSDSVPVLLGQTNFLMEFNVCFYRSQNYFEVWRG